LTIWLGLPSKKKVADEQMKRSLKTEHCNLTGKFAYVTLKMQIFISHFVFGRQPAEFFFSKKKASNE